MQIIQIGNKKAYNVNSKVVCPYQGKNRMINDQHLIKIEASADQVFKQIEIEPFPTFNILNTRPFLFLRIALIDGIKTAVRVTSDKDLSKKKAEPIKLGTSMGPFTLTEYERPKKYYFTLKSLFFNCRTGFFLNDTTHGSLLRFDIIAENPSSSEKFWWFFIKPIHALMAHKVLKTIQQRAEHPNIKK